MLLHGMEHQETRGAAKFLISTLCARRASMQEEAEAPADRHGLAGDDEESDDEESDDVHEESDDEESDADEE